MCGGKKGETVNNTYDYIHYYRRCWSDGGRYRTIVICYQLSENDNISITNVAEYLVAEVIKKHDLPMPLIDSDHRLRRPCPW